MTLRRAVLPTLLVLLILLSACGPQIPAAATVPTHLPSPLPTAAAEPAVTSTAPLAAPAETPTAAPTAAPATALAEPSPTATLSGWALIEDGAEWGVSPDERWIWALEKGTTDNDQRYHSTHIVSRDGRVEWRMQPTPKEVGRFSGSENEYRPFFWSLNDPYVFLVGTTCCWDGPVFFFSGFSLYRLNLETGQSTVIYPWGKMYHFSFSPSGKYLLSTYPDAQAITITRLRDAHAMTIALPDSFEQAGGTQWSSDGKHAFLRACVNLDFYSCGKIPVILIDPEETEFQTVVSDLKQALGQGENDVLETSWGDDDHILLKGPKYDLVYDLNTGKLSKR